MTLEGADSDPIGDERDTFDIELGDYPGDFPTASVELVFSPPSGTFEDRVRVEIVIEEGVANDIHYTTDGSTPTESSPVYDEPILVSTTTEIHAAVFKNGEVKAESTGIYIPRSSDISLDLPIVVIDNFGFGELDEVDRTYVHAVFMAFDVRDGEASLSTPPDVAARSGIHVRGQSSATFEKRPYRVELRDRHDKDQRWPVLGMPADADWVLRGPFVDKSLIRDTFHYTLGREIGIAAPRARFCELYTNFDGGVVDADDYQGVYMIVETIKSTSERIGLKSLYEENTDPEDISGGYIFKFEWSASEEPLLPCPGTENCWRELEIVEPAGINATQSEWLADYLYAFNEALHTSSLDDADTGYGQYIDATSFADQIIMNEIGREADSYIRSAYFFKDRDDIIHAGPLWDYNLSLGTGFDFQGIENLATTGWMYEMNNTRDDPSNDWFAQMAADPAFNAVLKARWQTLRKGALSDDALNDRIDELATPLKNGALRNFERWQNLDVTRISYFQSPATDTWEEQVEHLREWLMERVAWLDSQWS
jgi:hypothetical protein